MLQNRVYMQLLGLDISDNWLIDDAIGKASEAYESLSACAAYVEEEQTAAELFTHMPTWQRCLAEVTAARAGSAPSNRRHGGREPLNH